MRPNEAAAAAIGWLNRIVILAVSVFVVQALWPGGPADDDEFPAAPPPPRGERVAADPPRPAPPTGQQPARPAAPGRQALPGDDSLHADAARRAWTYVEQQYQPATGLVNSVAGYPYATLWDVGSGLAALYAGAELGLLEREEYDRRMAKALQTLNTVRLYDGAAFNKNYSTSTGRIAGRNDREEPDAAGHGWSATDIGRVLIWLRIIATTQPRHAQAARAVAARLDLDRMVDDGYLYGEDRAPRSGRKRRYQEGRLPYEQYAASGFALWGHRAEKALSLRENARPVNVLGIPLMADERGYDHVTSEPVILAGLEVGWTPEMAQLARGLLAAQEARWRQTGKVTIVSEDAIPRAPHYFYYYSVLGNGQPFALNVLNPRTRITEPRWVSAKAAFAWHALLPGEYTQRAVKTVSPAGAGPGGWASGVYEGTGTSTRGQNVNTAAVVLESALYHARGGRPFIQPGPTRPIVRQLAGADSARRDSVRRNGSRPDSARRDTARARTGG